MPTTSSHGLPVPELTDPPNGPAQIGALAGAIDTQMLTAAAELPEDPVDGQRTILLVDDTNGPAWEFLFSEAIDKWLFVGGAPLYDFVAGASSVPTSGYSALSNSPSVEAPVAGLYEVRFGALLETGLSAGAHTMVTPKLGSDAASANDRIHIGTSGGSGGTSCYQERTLHKTLAAAAEIVLWGDAVAADGNAAQKFISLRPISADGS